MDPWPDPEHFRLPASMTVPIPPPSRPPRHRKRTVHICLANVHSLGLNEDSARRGIKALEGAGLIAVGRRPGRGLDVTLMAAGDSLESEDGAAF